MGRVVIKAGEDLKIREFALDGFDQFSRVIHAADGVLDALQIVMLSPKLQNHLRRNGITGAVREIIDIYRAMNLRKELIVKAEQTGIVKAEIIRRDDHHRIGSLLQTPVGIRNNFRLHHGGGSDDAANSVRDAADGKACQLLSHFQIHGKELADASLHQNSVNPVCDQMLEQLSLALQVKRSILLKQGYCRCNIICLHSLILSSVRFCSSCRFCPFLFSLSLYSSPPPCMALRA